MINQSPAPRWLASGRYYREQKAASVTP